MAQKFYKKTANLEHLLTREQIALKLEELIAKEEKELADNRFTKIFFSTHSIFIFITLLNWLKSLSDPVYVTSNFFALSSFFNSILLILWFKCLKISINAFKNTKLIKHKITYLKNRSLANNYTIKTLTEEYNETPVDSIGIIEEQKVNLPDIDESYLLKIKKDELLLEFIYRNQKNLIKLHEQNILPTYLTASGFTEYDIDFILNNLPLNTLKRTKK